MSFSFNFLDTMAVEIISAYFPKGAKILDIGPGTGKYSDLLSGYDNMDCIEIFEPYIQWYELHTKYKKIYCQNVVDFDFLEHAYELVIMGDIMEHLSIADATMVINSIVASGAKIFIIVPFEYEQDEVRGNKYEAHLQPDLTAQIVIERYSDLIPLHITEKAGIFIGPNIWHSIPIANGI